MTPQEAIEAADLAEAETRYRHQLAREMYQDGWSHGYQAARRDIEAEDARRWADFARRLANTPAHAELEERRWGPGGREHFADPRPGDYAGGPVRWSGPRPATGVQQENENEMEAG